MIFYLRNIMRIGCLTVVEPQTGFWSFCLVVIAFWMWAIIKQEHWLFDSIKATCCSWRYRIVV